MGKKKNKSRLKKITSKLEGIIADLENHSNCKPIIINLQKQLSELKKISLNKTDHRITDSDSVVEKIAEPLIEKEIPSFSDEVPSSEIDDGQAPIEEKNIETEIQIDAINLEEKKAASPLPISIEISQEKDNINSDNLSPSIENLDQLPPKEEQNLKVKTKMIGKNGMVDKVYELQLSDITPPVTEFIINDIEGLETIGLKYDKENSMITGIPIVDGEFKFPVNFSSNHNSNLAEKELNILINPNPRSLWKELEPAEDEIYPKSHFDFDQVTFNHHSVFGCSNRGRSHAHQGTFRDDHFIIEALSNDVLFLSVADGAGSSKYSRKGSEIACKVARDTVSQELNIHKKEIIEFAEAYLADKENKESSQKLNSIVYQLIWETVKASRNEIIKKATEENHQVKDYSTTLLFSIIVKLSNKFFTIAYSIGDGIIAHIGNSVKLLSDPDGGEFAGQTRFLTMSDAIDTVDKRFKMTFIDDLSGLCLMTDGISDPYFETDANFSKKEKWEYLFNEIDTEVDFTKDDLAIQFKEWINFWSPGNHDDRTIAFIK